MFTKFKKGIFAISIVSLSTAVVEADDWKVIHAGTLLAVAGEGVKTEQSIVIKNDRIDRVEDGYIDLTVGDEDTLQIIDRKSSFVMPGLMDMHVHLDLNGEKWTRPRSEEARSAYGVFRALANAKKTLEAGFTTVRNPGGQGWAVFAVRDAVKNGAAVGPRIFAAGHTITASASEDYSGACSGVEECRSAVRRQIEMGADFIKIYATCSGSQPCGHGNARPVFFDDEMLAVIETAKTRQIKVAAHAHAVAGIHQALRLGVNSIEHGTFSDKKAYSLYKKNNVYMVPTVAVQDNVIRDYAKATDPDMRYVMKNAIDSHPEAVRGAYNAGVKIAAGSDAGVIPHGDNANELLWYVNKVGMTAEDALKAATIHGAELLGRTDDLGTIEAGKFADVIAMPENPLETIEAVKTISFVMKGGEVAVLK